MENCSPGLDEYPHKLSLSGYRHRVPLDIPGFQLVGLTCYVISSKCLRNLGRLPPNQSLYFRCRACGLVDKRGALWAGGGQHRCPRAVHRISAPAHGVCPQIHRPAGFGAHPTASWMRYRSSRASTTQPMRTSLFATATTVLLYPRRSSSFTIQRLNRSSFR